MPPFLLRKPKEARDTHRRARSSACPHRKSRQQHSGGEGEDDGNGDPTTCARCQFSNYTRQHQNAAAPPSSNTSRALTLAKKPPRIGAGGAAFALSPMAYSSGAEAYFFYHFREWTCDGLADSSPGSADFWKHYVLPLAQHDGLVRKTLAAVGAAHQLFVARSAPKTLMATPWSRKTDEMERATIQQYNTAISGMVSRMSAAGDAASSVETHIVLLCCLLFICFESMMGRYAESLKHFEAGARMLLAPASLQGIRDQSTVRHIADMFAHMGIEFSAFMDDEQFAPPILDGPESYFSDDQVCFPFADFTEAASALRAFDLAYVRGGFSAVSFIGHPAHETMQHAHTQRQAINSLPSPETTPLSTPTGEHAMTYLFRRWDARFEKTLEAQAKTNRPLSAFEERQLNRLRLQQKLWPVIFTLDVSCHSDPMHYVPDPVVDDAWAQFIEQAEVLAAPLIQQHEKSARPTFSLDGDLISALSLLITTTADPALEQRGLALLKALHRREGVWDSNEIAEMHEAALLLGDDAFGEFCPPQGGVPALTKVLAAFSKTTCISPNNGLLLVPDCPTSKTPPRGDGGLRWVI